MKRLPIALLPILVASSLSVALPGCHDDKTCVVPLDYITLDNTNGSGGTNHLNPKDLHPRADKLLKATMSALMKDGEELSDEAVETGIVDDEAGQNVLAYVARCALADKTRVVHACSAYPGGGLLTTTTGWINGALSLAQQEDLFTCLAAHLNPFAKVPIFLTGDSVAPTQWSDELGFDVDEALWAAQITEAGIFYHVWPLAEIEKECADVKGALQERVCGQEIADCGLVVHSDTSCVAGALPGHFTCEVEPGVLRPAISTKLKAKDLPAAYPSCFPAPM